MNKEEDELPHGSPTSKEEQVNKEEDELPHGSPTSKEEQVNKEEDELYTAWKSYLKGGACE